MPQCSRIKKPNRKPCAGDLQDRITLQGREIKAPRGASVDFTEEFTTLANVPAMIKTREGLETFDGTNASTLISHEIWIRFISGVTEETWILYKNKKYDIVRVENVDERDQWLKILARERGAESIRINRI